MHIRVQRFGFHLKGSCAPQTQHNAALILADLPPSADTTKSAVSLLAVLFQEVCQVGAADLLLPLQNDLHAGQTQLHWGRTSCEVTVASRGHVMISCPLAQVPEVGVRSDRIRGAVPTIDNYNGWPAVCRP